MDHKSKKRKYALLLFLMRENPKFQIQLGESIPNSKLQFVSKNHKDGQVGFIMHND